MLLLFHAEPCSLFWCGVFFLERLPTAIMYDSVSAILLYLLFITCLIVHSIRYHENLSLS